VIPVLTPEEMATVDRCAPEAVEILVGRAGRAVAQAALDLLGGAYGRRVLVLAGPGNNGADGRVAGALLAARGARVRVLGPGDVPQPPARLPAADLVIDAVVGTGLRRPYTPPLTAAPVLAVDIPSGLSGLTGEVPAGGGALRAELTVTFAALKPGLLLGEGPALTGPLRVAPIGLGVAVDSVASAWLVGDDDCSALPRRPRAAHKWQSAIGVVAGSPGMTGAAWTVCLAGLRAGAGYALLGVPGAEPGRLGFPPGEVVTTDIGEGDWVPEATRAVSRCSALVVGPGLGGSARAAAPDGRPGEPGAGTAVGRLLDATAELPAVVDADGLNALGSLDAVAAVADRRRAPVVLTPHEGEWARLTGAPPGRDRLAAVREAARRSRAVVLLKGSVTVVGAPDGRVLLAGSGSPRLATAGSGDALAGVIGAFLARGLGALEAAGLAAHVHGRAAGLGPAEGLIASDLPGLVSRWLSGERACPAGGAVEVTVTH